MIKRTLIYFLFFGLMINASAQDTLPLQLPDAINIALKNSLDIQLAKNNVEINTVLNNYGVAGGMPLVTGALTDNEQISTINQKLNTGVTIDRGAAAVNNLSSNVSGSVLLYNGNRVVATKARLNQLQIQSQSLLNAQVQNLMGSVMTAYYDVVRQQSYLKTIDRSIEVSQQQLDIIKARQSVGLANNADLFQAQIDLNAFVQNRQSQLMVIDQAKTEMLRLLTLRPDSSITIKDTIIVEENIMLDEMLNGVYNNSDIVAAQDQVRINELIVKETAAQRYPSIRANAGYNFSRNQAAAGQLLLNQSYGPSAGVTVALPIYNGSIFKRQQKVAEINVRNAELDKQVLLRDYKAQVVNSFQTYSNTLKQVKIEEETYKTSNQLLEIVLKRFEYRQATIVDLKIAQQSSADSGYRLVNLRYAAKAAEIELKRLANKLAL